MARLCGSQLKPSRGSTKRRRLGRHLSEAFSVELRRGYADDASDRK